MSEPQFQHMQAQLDGNVLVFTITTAQVEGDHIAAALREEMLEALRQWPVTKVAVDFRNVKLVSSAAFRPLLAVRRQIYPKNGRLVVCGLDPAVGDVFYATKVVDASGSGVALFDMQPDVGAAVTYLNGFAI